MPELSLDQCIAIIRTLSVSRSETGTGRFDKLHALMRKREQHFFNLPQADQKLPPPHEDAPPFQSDILRRTWVKAKSRLVEHPPRVRATPPSPGRQKDADEVEQAFMRMFDLVQEARGLNVLGDLADGKIIHGFGVLHWRKADKETYPDVPDYDSTDEPDEPKRYRERRDDDDAEKYPGKYIETDESVQARHRDAKATAGPPWYVDVIYPDTFAFVQDRTLANGMGITLTLREVPLLEYDEKLRDDGLRAVITAERKLGIWPEEDRPGDDEPSMQDASAWGRKVVIAEIWTRTHFYELANLASLGAAGKDGWVKVKSGTHPYGMPPYALALADYVNHPDPALAYMPMLEGLYRIKPFLDMDMTLGRAIASQIALPFYFIELADGSFMMGDDGKQIVFSRDALAATALPQGAKIHVISPDMNKSIIEFLQMTQEQAEQSMPETGQVDIGASTQPWTIRLGQSQANVPIKQYKENDARALRTMFRNWQHCMLLSLDEGGFGQSIPVRMDDGKIVDLDEKKLRDLIIDVDINPISDAQRVANIEHGRQLLSDPNTMYTPRDFLENDLQVEDVEEQMERATAWQLYVQQVQPGFMAQKVAERFGGEYVVDPNGQFVGADGQTTGPEEVLQAQGMQVQQSVVAESQPQMGAPAPLSVAGQPPVPGF